MAGLSFAISLAQLWSSDHPKPNLIIYERDTYDDRVGREGYTLSLRTDDRSGGVQILDKLGLYEKLHSVSVGKEGTMYMWDQTFDKPLINIRVKPFGPKKLLGMRIRRNALQKVLADASISAGWTIQWGKAINEVHRQADGRYLVNISGGGSATCDLLVAADGASSRIRSMVKPGYGLDFAGVVSMTGTARYDSAADVPKPLDKDWGLLISRDGTGSFAAPVDDKSALWSATYLSKEQRQAPRRPLSAEMFNELCVEAHSRTKRLDSTFHDLVDHTDPDTLQVFNAVDRPPFPHNAAQDGAAVFLGDANHAVSPFAGNGANMAVIDGWDLAGCLCSSNSFVAAFKEYDRKSIPRAAGTLSMSRWSIDVAHATGWKLSIYLWLLKVIQWMWVGNSAE